MQKRILDSVTEAMNTVDSSFERMEKSVGSIISPVQKTVFARFPILFTLLVTFGVAITFFGFERMVAEIAYLNDRPFLMLSTGLGILTLTGTLYKKLG